jgi:hypothetical protein
MKPSQPQESEKTKSADFMLAEYRVLQERFLSLRDEGLNRLNFFITLTSVITGGVLIFANNSNFSSQFVQILIVVAFFVLSIIGGDICGTLAARDRATDRVERGMTRIRHYFVQKDPSLSNFLIFAYHDDPTRYVTVTSGAGVRRSAQAIQSFIVSIIVGISANLGNLRIEYVGLLSILAFIVNFLILETRARKTYKDALIKAKNDAKFPSSKQKEK